MATANENQCPVCYKLFSSDVIQIHVEGCLKKSENCIEPAAKKSKLDKSAAWGCLAQSPVHRAMKKTMSAVVPKKISSEHTPEVPALIVQPSKDDDLGSSDLSTDKITTKETTSFSCRPLADQMRPLSLNDYYGQEELFGRTSILRSAIENFKIPNMILWGPPGCGKTTLAKIIANLCKENRSVRFVTFSATSSGIGDVKDVVRSAQSEQKLLHRQTILFMDEIHRFNKLQQDTFLPHVESGTITLIGATTENPSFSLNSALLSRCRVFVFQKLTTDAVEKIVYRALNSLRIPCVDEELKSTDAKIGESEEMLSNCFIERGAVQTLANFSDGDARIALNGLQLAIQHSESITEVQCASGKTFQLIKQKDVKEALLRTHTLYDRKGDEHYNIISALHKSIRGSDANASLYWLARMLVGGEDPLYIARRLIRCAAEDIGLADPLALQQAINAYQGCQFVGLPECKVILAQCVVYLARCPKSVEIYRAYSKAEECIKKHEGPLPAVPLHLRNAPTQLMKNLGYGANYKYNPNYEEPVEQLYLPLEIKKIDYFSL